MLKKVRMISAAMIMALTLTGAGYAQWTDRLVINNTVETGELNMEFVQDNIYSNAKGDEYVESKIEIDRDNHTAKVTINNLYPGAYAKFRVKGENTGTIPTKIDGINVEFEGNKNLLKHLTYETKFFVDGDGDGVIANENESINLEGNLEELGKDFNNEITNLQKIRLEPNNKGSFYLGGSNKDDYFIIRFKEDAPKETQGKKVEFTLTLNFKQFNVN